MADYSGSGGGGGGGVKGSTKAKERRRKSPSKGVKKPRKDTYSDGVYEYPF